MSYSLPVIQERDNSAKPTTRATPESRAVSPRLPRWLKRQVPKGNANHFTARLLDDLDLETVCDHARCPNRMECYAAKTATFMVMGEVCTRPCNFCSVAKGKTSALDADEPARVAEAAARLGLGHVVITSVTRDDLPDGGAEHLVRCIEAVRAATRATVEVLTPDFAGSTSSVDRVIDARPDVFNHNTETVPRLYGRVRGRKSDYRWTLALLGRIKQRAPGMLAKTGLMLGLGETHEELLEVVADLVDVGCDMLTLGQYLQPSLDHMPVVRYLPPEEFDELGRLAQQIGIPQVASGPFVRSSYRARELISGVDDRGE